MLFKQYTLGKGVQVKFPIDKESCRYLQDFSLDPWVRRSDLLFPIRRRIEKHDLEDFEQLEYFYERLVQIVDDLSAPVDQYKKLGINYLEALVAESLAKVASYRERLPSSLRIPLYDRGWKLKRFSLSLFSIGVELPVLIAVPDNPKLSAWVIPRGTSPFFGVRMGAFESLCTDITRVGGLDHRPFDYRIKELRERLFSVLKEGQTLLIAGHSLGGYFAHLLAIEFADRVKSVYSFGSTAISRESVEKLQKLKGSFDLFVFNNIRDPVPAIGEKLFGKIFQLTPKSGRRGLLPTAFHICMTLNQDHLIEEVDIEREEGKRERGYIEFFRYRLVGGLVRGILTVIGKDRFPWLNLK